MEIWPIVKSSCESPIEEIFLQSWMIYASPWRIRSLEEFTTMPDKVPFNATSASWQVNFIFPQQKIESFRVDFVLGRYSWGRDESVDPAQEFMRKLPLIVVECDGHDFHERTADQAGKDKSRDRRLTALGFRVLRFTGRELHRNIEKCMDDVNAVFYQFEKDLVTLK